MEKATVQKHSEELEASNRTLSPENENVSKPERSSFEEEEDRVPHLHAKTFLIVFAVCLIYFAQVINVVGSGAFARQIAAVVGGSTDTVWLASSVAILTTVLSPPVSQASDYWGRRWFLIILTVLGAVGCIIVACATSMPMAIAGEVVAGLSYGAQPLFAAVASEVVPRRHRPFAQSACNVAAALGGFTALMSGEAMMSTNPEGFRNFWYMATAIYVLAALLCFVLYNPPPQPSQLGLTNMEKLKKLDWIGYALMASGLILFSVGLSFGQNPYPWSDGHVLAPLIVGIVLIIGLVIYSWKFKKDGMFHHGLFSQGSNFAIALVCVFVEGLSFFAGNNYFAFEVGVIYETDALRIGIRYGMMFLLYAVFSVLGGLWSSATKSVKIPTVVAFCFLCIFHICMSTATPKSSDAVWGFPIFLAIGLGVCLCALVTVAQLCTPKELIATSTGLMISVRSFGGSVGLAIYNSIFTNKITANLGPKIAGAALPAGLPASSLPAFIGALAANNATALGQVEGVTPQIIGAGVGGLKEAYSIAFRYVWIAAACLTVIAVVAAAFLKDPTKEFNMHIDAPAEKDEDLYSLNEPRAV